MKFYEFNKFEHYALIGAKNEKEAIEYYEKIVSSIGTGDGVPDLISKVDAIKKTIFVMNNTGIKENIEKMVEDNSSPLLLLVDGNLL